MNDETRRSIGERLRLGLDVAVAMVIVVLGTQLIWRTAHSADARAVSGADTSSAAARITPPLPSAPVSLEGATLKGRLNAKVALIIYSDFQCPFCGRFARETMPQLQRYVDSGDVLIAFRHFPLTQIHRFAEKAAEFAECANRQGRFWEVHDRIFANQDLLDLPDLLKRARSLAIDDRLFTQCLNGEAADHVRNDADTAKTLSVTGTPTIFIGLVQRDGRVQLKERVGGALPFDQFRQFLDRTLSSAARSSN